MISSANPRLAGFGRYRISLKNIVSHIMDPNIKALKEDLLFMEDNLRDQQAAMLRLQRQVLISTEITCAFLCAWW